MFSLLSDQKMKPLNVCIFLILFFSVSFLHCGEKEEKKETAPQTEIISPPVLIKDVKSAYSRMKVIDESGIRNLYFVRDSGEEVLESAIHLYTPEKLQVLYTKKMFSSFLIFKNPKSVLMAGLGGGGIVHFMQFFFPDVSLDTVEIDAEIVKTAKELFYVKEKENSRIYIADFLQYAEKTEKKYDLIFLDAFLKPSDRTDPSGTDKRFKEEAFYGLMKKRLNPKGALVINVNTFAGYEQDILRMKKSFSNVYLFNAKGSGNVIAVCSTDSEKVSIQTMSERGDEIDLLRKPNFSFKKLSLLERTEEILKNK
ncbi:MAG TPA: methyltransferase [Leptospiraceae bacterium]|nr:methyltransferase [Leptospiraceae bacterium]HNF12476.1 methyltransferase [Leptospiraceae bacterium]HNF25043.1 methyltransferase [Leptospiraceae bacterium]HNI94491.1 methyltransferase [Leptospiraceae bacterium]HNM03742.1 methyltransferase [Leptospiraceae bacterium]